MRHEIVAYAADGLTMRGDFYVDDRVPGPRPGVLVFPEGGGIDAHPRSRAERLAAQGYAALACDLHGDAFRTADMDDLMARLTPLLQDPARIRARARGAMDALVAREEVDAGRVAAIGFCFGGTMALELARSGAAIAAAVGFHSGLGTPDPAAATRIAAKLLVCLGADDPGITAAHRLAFEEEMRAGGVDWRMHVYGGVVHSFTNPASDAMGRPAFARYDAGADARSWREMLALFDEVFG